MLTRERCVCCWFQSTQFHSCRRSGDSDRYGRPATREFTRLVGTSRGLATLSPRSPGFFSRNCRSARCFETNPAVSTSEGFFARATMNVRLLDAIWLNAALAENSTHEHGDDGVRQGCGLPRCRQPFGCLGKAERLCSSIDMPKTRRVTGPIAKNLTPKPALRLCTIKFEFDK